MAGNAFCRACGAEILDETEICPKCGVRQKPAQVKNPGLAAVASFFGLD
ncbi:zinc-ribbon domain-containing protein [Methanosarcina barkeri]|nr:zinc-ribbon domain-containing protein [Methanosarcina barkeri]